MKSLLIMSYSEIPIDARVRKQVALFENDYRVTTLGHGGAYSDSVPHLSIEAGVSNVWRYAELLAGLLRLNKLAIKLNPVHRRAVKALRGKKFDSVLVNDLNAVPAAFTVAPGRQIHVDLHEYWPGLHDDVKLWVLLRVPVIKYILKKYVTKAKSVTNVNRAIADIYRSEYGFSSEVVRNAAPSADYTPGRVANTIRIVHSGVANPERNLEAMMHAVAESKSNITLDLILMPQGDTYYAQVKELAKQLGDRINVIPPVKQGDLVATLNRYDAGITLLPDTPTNNSLALPNKFFDYIQARLAVISGPTPAVQDLISENSLGVCATKAGAAELREVFDSLTPEKVAEFKQNSHAAAAVLNAESEAPVWQRAIERLG